MLCGAATLAMLVTPVFADLVSTYAVSGHNTNGSSYTGKITFTPAGQVYRVDYCCDKQNGFAIEYQNFLAIAEVGGDGGNLVIYQRAGNAWIGVFSQYGDDPLGAEVLYNGSAPGLPDPGRASSGNAAGKYRISGTNPNGSAYSGEVEVTRSGTFFDVDRTIGDDETTGTAIVFNGAIAMNVGKEDGRAPLGVLGLFVPEGNGFIGVWAKAGSQQLGAERWVRESK